MPFPVLLVPLASNEQIEKTPSREDGIPADLEEDLRAYGCKLIVEAGVLLKQKQVAVATAQILFQRFWFVTSMKHFGIGDIAMGALFLASKLEECILRIRDLINVYDVLLQREALKVKSHAQGQTKNLRYVPMTYFGNTFYDLKDAIVVSEMQILKRIGFNTHIVLPYGTLVNYLRVLGLTDRDDVSSQAWGYLNDALQTPVYTIYSVPTIVSAAIVLTTRFIGISLPSTPPNCWWELFDAEWEDVWIVCAYIVRLYRQRSVEDRIMWSSMITKKGVREWLEQNGSTSAAGGSRDHSMDVELE